MEKTAFLDKIVKYSHLFNGKRYTDFTLFFPISSVTFLFQLFVSNLCLARKLAKHFSPPVHRQYVSASLQIVQNVTKVRVQGHTRNSKYDYTLRVAGKYSQVVILRFDETFLLMAIECGKYILLLKA